MNGATVYFETLRARLVAERRTPAYQELMGNTPAKISVLCPVYKPKLADFAAAVESVRRQSWTDWELIIVDDGSASPALTEVIDDLCKSDKRIRAVPQKKNQGISAATNAAIAAATGDWIALFDHDDLLVGRGARGDGVGRPQYRRPNAVFGRGQDRRIWQLFRTAPENRLELPSLADEQLCLPPPVRRCRDVACRRTAEEAV